MALLISGLMISSIFLVIPTELAFSQVKQKSALETLQGIFRPRRRPAGTRGPICLITPGLKPAWVSLSGIPFVLSDRPLFLWQQPVTRVEVRLATSNAVVWSQTLPPNSRSIFYHGTPLQSNQTYQVVAFGSKNYPLNTGEDAQFTLVSTNERARISADMAQKETELKHQNRSTEEIAIAQAIDLSKQSLLSDAFQLLYSLPDRSPKLNSFLTDIMTKACSR
ncbi:hypothetical protein [Phormidesmis priestleyi]